MNISQINSFIEDGFLKIEEAFPAKLAAECRDILWRESGCDPSDPDTWKHPVVRIAELAHEPFRKAANTARLHDAFDALTGKGAWLPRTSLGSFPLRFPSQEPANDTGWHVDASFPGDGDPSDYFNWRINYRSKGRALLMLFLFSDVGPDDAPTRIRKGSHLDVAEILWQEGERGLSFMELAGKLADMPEREIVVATGNAGTVYLCHPFLVHAAQDHRGQHPKFMAQPPLLPARDVEFDQEWGNYSPVAEAILKGIINK